jgi:hypothetical protein
MIGNEGGFTWRYQKEQYRDRQTNERVPRAVLAPARLRSSVLVPFVVRPAPCVHRTCCNSRVTKFEGTANRS